MQPKLIIKKRLIQATVYQTKPSINAIARLPLDMRGVMLDDFGHESLFKKAIMIGGRPIRAEDNKNSPFETRVLDAFFKREESLEITVSSLMIGQTYVGANIWDALGFEIVVKRAFNSMLTLLETVQQFDNEIVYLGQSEISRPTPIEQNSPTPIEQKSESGPRQPVSPRSRLREVATARNSKVQMDGIAT